MSSSIASEAFGKRLQKMSQSSVEQSVADHLNAIGFSRAEHELLICCARTQPHDRIMQRITSLLQEDLDWSLVIRLARQHWVMPLLYWNVSKVDEKLVPRSVTEQLRDHFRENTKRNFFLAHELAKLLESLKKSSIRALPYKGPMLAFFAYENLALRTFTDLDILIDPRDFDVAKRLLCSLNYTPDKELNSVQARISMLSGYEHLFVNHMSAVEIEVHWAAWKRDLARTPSQSDLWGRASVASLFGTDIAIPSPEDMILLSAIHGMKHLWQKLQLICDIAELIRVHPAMNWTLIMELAHKLGNERMLLVGLLLASDLVSTAVPAYIQRKAREDAAVVHLVAQIERRLFHDPQGSKGDLESLSSIQISDVAFVLRSKERLTDQARSVLALLMLPTLTDYKAVPLPAPLIGLYLAVHPALIVKRHVAASARSDRPDRLYDQT